MSGLFVRAAALAVAVSGAQQAQALSFNLISSIDQSTVAGQNAFRGFQMASNYWSSVLTDNVTMNLSIGFAQLDTGVLAQAGSARALITMQQYYSASAVDATTATDAMALASLQPLTGPIVNYRGGATGALTVTGNAFANGVDGTNGYTDLATRLDNDGSTNNRTLAVTKANAKALGLTVDVNGNAINYGSLDATLTFSSAFNFDFDPTDGIGSTAFDFLGVAIHEIGHSLGFTSGVDSYDARTAPGQTVAGQLSSLEGLVVANSLDLYRYGAEGKLDWSTQGTPYFSLDGGKSQLFGDSRLSMGRLNGDGQQASHWKDSPARAPQLGVLDPTSGRGQMQDVTALDLAAFDTIGWNANVDAVRNSGYRMTTAQIYAALIPEPSTWAMMLVGFGGIAMSLRRRARKVSVTFG